MEFYEVEGMTLLHWRMTVTAPDEHEAIDGVPERIASCVGSGPSPVSFTSIDHRVVQCEPANLEERRLH